MNVKTFVKRILRLEKKSEWKILIPISEIKHTHLFWEDCLKIYDKKYVFYNEKYYPDEVERMETVFVWGFPLTIRCVDIENKLIYTKLTK